SPSAVASLKTRTRWQTLRVREAAILRPAQGLAPRTRRLAARRRQARPREAAALQAPVPPRRVRWAARWTRGGPMRVPPMLIQMVRARPPLVPAPVRARRQQPEAAR